MLGTELFGDPALPRDETLARLLEHANGAARVYDPDDWGAPYASGSAKVDAYVICPCSMGTLGTVASGAMQNLIHRAASVALKEERRLVLMPRETPLSAIHLRNMLTLREAGATILFLAPGFYHGAETVENLVDFIVARALDLLGLEHALTPRWGQWSLPATHVRVSPAITLRAAASSVGPIGTAIGPPCVLASLGVRDRDIERRHREGHS